MKFWQAFFKFILDLKRSSEPAKKNKGYGLGTNLPIPVCISSVRNYPICANFLGYKGIDKLYVGNLKLRLALSWVACT